MEVRGKSAAPSGAVKFMNLDQNFPKNFMCSKFAQHWMEGVKPCLLELHRLFNKHLQVSLILLVFFGLLEIVFKLFYLDIGDHVFVGNNTERGGGGESVLSDKKYFFISIGIIKS